MHALEWRRQFLHLFYGPILVVLHAWGVLPPAVLLGMVVGGLLMSYMIRHERLHGVRKALAYFERDHHMVQFPGRGIIFFTLGSYLALILFATPIAYASILVLSVGDAVCNLAGRHWGRIKTRLNPHKALEGTLAGILFSAPVAWFFVHDWPAAVLSTTVAMFLELPHVSLFGFEIDDNLLIPLATGVGLTLFA